MELGASRTVAVEVAALAQSVVIVAQQVQRVTVDLVRRPASLALIRSALTLPVPTLSRVVVVAAQVARTRRRRQVGALAATLALVRMALRIRAVAAAVRVRPQVTVARGS